MLSVLVGCLLHMRGAALLRIVINCDITTQISVLQRIYTGFNMIIGVIQLTNGPISVLFETNFKKLPLGLANGASIPVALRQDRWAGRVPGARQWQQVQH